MKRKNKKYNWTDVSQMESKGFRPGQVFRLNENGQETGKIRTMRIKQLEELGAMDSSVVESVKRDPYLMLDCSQVTFVSCEDNKDLFVSNDGREFSIPFATNTREAHKFLQLFSPVS